MSGTSVTSVTSVTSENPPPPPFTRPFLALTTVRGAGRSSYLLGREFLVKYYEQLKTLNPGLPIYIRPCEGVEPTIAARFGELG